MDRVHLPRGRDMSLPLEDAARRYCMKPGGLRALLVRAEWVRLSRNTWASLATTSLVTLRQFDRLDDRDLPLEVRP
jgi:hypothetical protein